MADSDTLDLRGRVPLPTELQVNKNDLLSGKVILNFKIKVQDMVIDRTKLIKLPLPRRFWFQEIEKLVERSVENKDWFCVIGPDQDEIEMLEKGGAMAY